MVLVAERHARTDARPTQKGARAMVIGSGGREHSIAWKLMQELGDSNVLFVPGNAGVQDWQRRNVNVTDFATLYDVARFEGVDLVVVGPEQPLAEGIVNYFSDRGMPIFGPTSEAAEIESRKIKAKRFMAARGIPTSIFVVPDSDEDLYRFAKQFLEADGAAVLKADGLAGGKGVSVCKSDGQLRNEFVRLQGLRAGRIFVERFLRGEEVSYIAFTDGYDILPLLLTQDHKQLLDGDEGPMTGGMGAYTGPRIVTPQLEVRMREIMLSAVRGMAEEGRPFKGIFYAGFMIVDGEPYVLEFNCRAGDPEMQPVMVRMKSSLLDVMYAAIENRLSRQRMLWKPGEAMTVVLATQGYPDEKEYKNHLWQPIHGLDRAYPGVTVFHAGTARRDGHIVNSGGRVLSVTGVGETLSIAGNNVYSAIGEQGIHLPDMNYRKDVGRRSLR